MPNPAHGSTAPSGNSSILRGSPERRLDSDQRVFCFEQLQASKREALVARSFDVFCENG